MRLSRTLMLASAAAACAFVLATGPVTARVNAEDTLRAPASTNGSFMQLARRGGPEKGDDKGGKRGGKGNKGGKGRGGHDDGPNHT